MTGRIRTQKKVFTPTTNTIEPEAFLCQIIETGEYVIVQRSSIKRTYDDTAEIMVHNRRIEAKIEFRGWLKLLRLKMIIEKVRLILFLD